MTEQKSLWEIRLGVYVTERDVELLQERITLLLCPDPEHPPPCPIPWSVCIAPDVDSDHAHLRVRYEIEAGLREP